jgi:hypothetical protein
MRCRQWPETATIRILPAHVCQDIGDPSHRERHPSLRNHRARPLRRSLWRHCVNPWSRSTGCNPRADLSCTLPVMCNMPLPLDKETDHGNDTDDCCKYVCDCGHRYCPVFENRNAVLREGTLTSDAALRAYGPFDDNRNIEHHRKAEWQVRGLNFSCGFWNQHRRARGRFTCQSQADGTTQFVASGSRGIQISTGPMGCPVSEMPAYFSNSGAFFSRRPDVGSQLPSNQIQVSRSRPAWST